MFSFSSLTRQYPRFRQLAAVLVMLSAGVAQGQISFSARDASLVRRPASYIPDDDVIVRPVDNELSFYQQYIANDNAKEVVQTRNQLKVWNDNQVFADQYHLNTTLAGSAFFVPTQEEKLEYFKSKYMRYLQKRGTQPLQNMPKNWYQSYRASNEVDTIDEMEARFRSSQKKTSTERALPKSLQTKEVSIWKQTKLIFQPRPEQGLVVVGINSPIAVARAWVGVNGQAEINVQQSYASTGTRFMVNYYTNSGKYFTSVDQRLMESVYARVTRNIDPTTKVNDNTLMLLYAKQF